MAGTAMHRHCDDFEDDEEELCRLAELFTKPSFYVPVVALKDPLPGLHANTHLAQVGTLPVWLLMPP